MDHEFEQRVGRIAEEALDLPEEELDSFLTRACAGDTCLRREVEALLDCMDDGNGSPLPGGLQELVAEARQGRAPAFDTLADEVITKVPYDQLVDHLATPADGGSRYQMRGEVGRGGMAAVLRVWDENLHRPLAMKVILGEGDAEKTGDTPPADSKLRRRFLEEAHVTGRLDHPGIVPVHELGVDDRGRVYFTMKLVKGRTLDRVFDDVASGADGWTQVRAVGLILRICEAVAYAHDKGVIHRDLKPTNVMVGRFGEVYVMDWGLARILSEPNTGEELGRHSSPGSFVDEAPDPAASHLTEDGDVLGTPAYMPPEQACGDRASVGPHSDVYAVGAMLYHLITERAPYVGADERPPAHVVLQRVLAGPPRPCSELSPSTPPELAAICDKAMARDPGARYSSLQGLAEDLQAHIEGRVVAAHATGAWPETRKWIQRNRALAAALASVLGVLIAGLTWTRALNAELAGVNESLRATTREAGRSAAEAEASAVEAREKEQEAIAARQRAEARRLANLAGTELERDPELALLLAIESADLLPGHDARVLLDRCLEAAGLLPELEASEGPATVLACSRDGRWVAGGDLLGNVRVWNATTGELVHTAWCTGVIAELSFDDSGTLLAALSSAQQVILLDMSNGAELGRVGMPDWPLRIGFQPGTQLLVLQNGNGYRRAWDGSTGREVEPPPVLTIPGSYIEHSPDERRAIVWSETGGVSLIDGRTGEPVRELPLEFGQPKAAVFTDDGEYVVVHSGLDEACVLQTETGVLDERIRIVDQFIDTIAFSPDGRWLATTDARTAAIWNWREPSRWWTLRVDPLDAIRAVEFEGSSAGVFVARGGAPIRRHFLDPLEAARGLAGRSLSSTERERLQLEDSE